MKFSSSVLSMLHHLISNELLMFKINVLEEEWMLCRLLSEAPCTSLVCMHFFFCSLDLVSVKMNNYFGLIQWTSLDLMELLSAEWKFT